MNIFFKFVFIFFIGSTFGWVLELFFRRIYNGKWVNPGFLNGPYLPIYGFGLSILTFLHIFLDGYDLNPILVIIIMTVCMNVIELISGLIFLKNGIRLWDYRDMWGNYKGVVCPTFFFIWAIFSAIYYYLVSTHLFNALEWYSNNTYFSFVLGIFTGVIVLDFAYSTELYKKIKNFARNNGIDIMYERLKLNIKEIQESAKEKYSFVFPFKQTRNLKDYLGDYMDKYNKGEIKINARKNKKK